MIKVSGVEGTRLGPPGHERELQEIKISFVTDDPEAVLLHCISIADNRMQFYRAYSGGKKKRWKAIRKKLRKIAGQEW